MQKNSKKDFFTYISEEHYPSHTVLSASNNYHKQIEENLNGLLCSVESTIK